jgi:hypothetical protein
MLQAPIHPGSVLICLARWGEPLDVSSPTRPREPFTPSGLNGSSEPCPTGLWPRLHPPPRRFQFERDTFAFANELVCEYRFDLPGGRPKLTARVPRPDYTLRCFVLARAARQFLYHAEFQPDLPSLPEAECRARIRQVISRNPRIPCASERRVQFPGCEGLRAFSRIGEKWLKAACGGAWRSYVLRSHWRMVFPLSRRHQARTAERLQVRLTAGFPPIVHLVRFPQLTINHGMLLFDAELHGQQTTFLAYDPNDPARPARLAYAAATRTFSLPANRYWAGGNLDVIEIYRSWWF